MKVDLSQKVALVTGGARGIGRAIVEKLIENGATTYLIDIDRKAVTEAIQELEEQGRSCGSFIGDVTTRSPTWSRRVQTILQRSGRFDRRAH
ncbi:MAG: SDR family NAD(P)-dependent oxidoreductase [Terriglobia bacterium]